VPSHAVRVPCGWPAETSEQVPTLPLMSQALHCSVHVVLQQTPSTQYVEPPAHALGVEVQAAPFGRWHVPGSPATLQN
jgi:hypothetical protein